MEISDLNHIDVSSELDCDLVVVGGGAAGLSIAREFFHLPTRVIVIESGKLEEDPRISSLNRVESDDDLWTGAQTRARSAFHGANSRSWSHEEQRFGVRCRVLGGSTHAWAGRSAAFDEIDFEKRDWVPNSGWPITRPSLECYLDRAAEILNLGPNCYDDDLWRLIGTAPPKPSPDAAILRSFFWQFARSRIDRFDLLRMGPEFVREKASNIRVLLNATATEIIVNGADGRFQAIAIASIEGARTRIVAKTAVLAASAIENARLLLNSRGVWPCGVGNQNDLVGRYMTDHLRARIGHFNESDIPKVVSRFGFFGVRHNEQTALYLRGLAPTREVLARDKLLNSAIYMTTLRAPDDPWDALKRILRRTSGNVAHDALAVVKSPGILAKGMARRVFQSRAVPDRVKALIIDQLVRLNPNFVVQEFQTGGLPHKLSALAADAMVEQPPDHENRVCLSERTDAFGIPLPHVHWRIDPAVRKTAVRLGHLLRDEFQRVGLPPVILDSAVDGTEQQDLVFIDMAHTSGTTRMSDTPTRGVVDASCEVFNTKGLFVAGSSVFPTGGHANPTLMLVALAVRLADHLKRDLAGVETCT